MNDNLVHLFSYYQISAKIFNHLNQGHHTALVGSPGCGISTFIISLKTQFQNQEVNYFCFDFRDIDIAEFEDNIETVSKSNNKNLQVIIIDHIADLEEEECNYIIKKLLNKSSETNSICLWCGCIDARTIVDTWDIKICTVPSSHITFPILNRDELISVYRNISEYKECKWGEAILYLMLDFCNTDLTLVSSATDYFHGDWNDKLYDESIWDKINEWLRNETHIDKYREVVKNLPSNYNKFLSLFRFGGKPLCKRVEIYEETDNELRFFCIKGFLIQNSLPNYYQLRNLSIKHILNESINPSDLFRRATNERIFLLLQDVESMLRNLVLWAFNLIGLEEIKKVLLNMQKPGKLISSELDSLILKWVKSNCSESANSQFVEIINEKRKQFKISNSVWENIVRLMKQDNESENDENMNYLQCVEYLTFNELKDLIINLLDLLFKPSTNNVELKNRLKESLNENISKINRLRNQVAHHRNIHFQDIEDLRKSIEILRNSIINFGGWREYC